MINPGDFKHKVKIFKVNVTKDEDGFKKKEYVELLKTKCSISKKKYTDNYRSNSKNLDTSKTLIYCSIRYNKNIDETCVVEIYGERYRVKSLNNVNYENKILELTLQDG